MSGSRHLNSRRRYGSSSRRYKSSRLVPVDGQRSRFGMQEVLAGLGITTVAILLISLIWMLTSRSIEDQRAEIRDRVEQSVTALAAVLSEEVRHELLLVDQSLAILQATWAAVPDSFNLIELQKQMPALTSVADDIFIADDKRIIRQDIIPAAVNQGIGAAYVNFPHGSLESLQQDGSRTHEGRTIVVATGAPIEARQYLMYVVRPLSQPTNWIIGASFRSEELTKLYAASNLGYNGVAAMIDLKRGAVQAIAGTAARRPKVDVSHSPMFAAITAKDDAGLWSGPTGMDGVERILAFHRVPGRDMVVVVGAMTTTAMAPADSLAATARGVALSASGVVVMIASLVLWAVFNVRSLRRRARALLKAQSNAASLQNEVTVLSGVSQLLSAQVRAIMEGTGNAVALFDPELRLTVWNPIFAATCGLLPDALVPHVPLDEILRQQARAGLFGPLSDLEAEVSNRLIALRTDSLHNPQVMTTPDGAILLVHGQPLPDGGLVVMAGAEGAAGQALADHSALHPVSAEDAPAGSAPQTIEW